MFKKKTELLKGKDLVCHFEVCLWALTEAHDLSVQNLLVRLNQRVRDFLSLMIRLLNNF